MTMVDGPTGFIMFRNEPFADAADGCAGPDGQPGSVHYFRERERAERAAAKRATSAAARSLHQELAQSYAQRARSCGGRTAR